MRATRADCYGDGEAGGNVAEFWSRPLAVLAGAAIIAGYLTLPKHRDVVARTLPTGL